MKYHLLPWNVDWRVGQDLNPLPLLWTQVLYGFALYWGGTCLHLIYWLRWVVYVLYTFRISPLSSAFQHFRRISHHPHQSFLLMRSIVMLHQKRPLCCRYTTDAYSHLYPPAVPLPRLKTLLILVALRLPRIASFASAIEFHSLITLPSKSNCIIFFCPLL